MFLRGIDAKVAWHLYLMAQPKGLPERMIAAVAEEFFASFLDAWDPAGTTVSLELRRHYIASSTQAAASIVADYRASAGIDLDMDRADRVAGHQLSMPVGVISHVPSPSQRLAKPRPSCRASEQPIKSAPAAPTPPACVSARAGSTLKR